MTNSTLAKWQSRAFELGRRDALLGIAGHGRTPCSLFEEISGVRPVDGLELQLDFVARAYETGVILGSRVACE